MWSIALGRREGDRVAVQVRAATLDLMVKMNVDRAGGGDDDFGGVGAEPTMPAKYAGTCATCRQRFAVGEPIASVLVDKKMTYHHRACRYAATAFLAEHTADTDADTTVDSTVDTTVDTTVDVTATAHRSPPSSLCLATTRKGKPCSNAPQQGERYCGPHLTQRSR